MRNTSQKSVFLLDGSQKSTLAALRSLGKKGIKCTVGESFSPHLCFKSKFCHKNILYPSPITKINKFKQFIWHFIENNSLNAVFPMTDITIPLIIDIFENTKYGYLVSHLNSEKYHKASDKIFLVNLAKSLSVPVPETTIADETSNVFELAKSIKYPVVLKPYKSKIFFGKEIISLNVSYANNPEELINTLKLCSRYKINYMIQQKIEGEGIGHFSLWQNGVKKMAFNHKRLLEKPPSGGVSVLCESIAEDFELNKFAAVILEELNWHGVAMVEFKKDDKTGILYLMEINARFWGSLELAIRSGVDFPYYTFKMIGGEKLSLSKNDYKIGTLCTWATGILDHFYLLLKDKNNKELLKSFQKLMHLNKMKIYDMVFHKDDFKPFIFEMYQNIKNVF